MKTVTVLPGFCQETSNHPGASRHPSKEGNLRSTPALARPLQRKSIWALSRSTRRKVRYHQSDALKPGRKWCFLYFRRERRHVVGGCLLGLCTRHHHPGAGAPPLQRRGIVAITTPALARHPSAGGEFEEHYGVGAPPSQEIKLGSVSPLPPKVEISPVRRPKTGPGAVLSLLSARQ